MKFDPTAVEQAGELMLVGMGGVFIVLFIIYLVAKLLLKFAPAKKAAK
ncbi:MULTISPECIES: OadG family protein [Lacticaseibacillus]|uniref:Oxaloacetate decarboxylase, gamma chain family protein n=2 Tax=Lacticaseibacillus zeae TaxID=57037 RepID=A0A5R8LJP1_LACZE|nr:MULTISPECIES: OadG family protein [Lacticaseibacillus]OFS00496.1 oxaloacetate decarboxylase, gamma chain family protein [Lactobacillus sp. HMSC068F07]KLI76741.1 oxaloacetate decarboxylase, gamma chain family protein [Lacticaseibacillus casei]MDE3282793.1 OadG family protein [Lacticaseibacillus casei]MDE3315594.1 OadG family protein [Lacticaseibacillus zeae]OLS09538.1 oxaloacetate decarboxylase, gamma chain family protein [Lacticaseibacillus casei]